MSVNPALSDAFSEIARFIDLLGEDKFRAIAHDKAARAVAAYPADLGPIARASDARKQLTQIEGVGPKIADKIVEFCTTGKLRELEELRAQVPRGLLPLMQVQGLGPKTLHSLWKDGGVTDVKSLKRLIESGKILELPRMGEKSVAKLKEAIAHAEGASGSAARLPLGLAVFMAEGLVERLGKVKGVKHIAYAGSLRRGRDTVGDIDIIAAASDPGALSEAFRAEPAVREVLTAGEGRASVRMAVVADGGRWGLDEMSTGPSVQVDLKIVPEESWGAALHYFTGSKDHNIALRQRALDRGLTLNDFGLFPNDDDPTPPQRRGIKAVASRTEEDIFAALGLPFIPPEVREGRDDLRLKATPRLVEVGDIRAELHAHTTASDGSLSIAELAAEAQRRGFHTIAVTDHSKSSAIAGGLSPERLRDHAAAVRAANGTVKGGNGKAITILAGSEVDILADGRLDYDDETLALLDVVVASPHAGLSQDTATATKRLLRAIANPFVHIIGHPTGRLINRRPGVSPDMAEVIAAAKEHNVALEINSHWMRLDLRDTHVHEAVRAGCLIAIDCDVHSLADFECLRFGVQTGRRGWLTPELCINTWPREKLHAWLRGKRG